MSAKTYKTSKGVKWKTNVWLTAPFCPGIVFADLFIMNLIPWVEESSVPSLSVLWQKSLQCGLEFQYHWPFLSHTLEARNLGVQFMQTRFPVRFLNRLYKTTSWHHNQEHFIFWLYTYLTPVYSKQYIFLSDVLHVWLLFLSLHDSPYYLFRSYSCTVLFSFMCWGLSLVVESLFY